MYNAVGSLTSYTGACAWLSPALPYYLRIVALFPLDRVVEHFLDVGRIPLFFLFPLGFPSV